MNFLYFGRSRVVSYNGDTQNGWFIDVYRRKSIYKWLIWGYPYFWKPPNDVFLQILKEICPESEVTDPVEMNVIAQENLGVPMALRSENLEPV